MPVSVQVSKKLKRKTLKKYKKKVRKSTAYKKGKTGRLQKRIDKLTRKRKLG